MNTNEKKYKLLKDAYYGIGYFENGAGLRKYPRESQENFKDRQELAYYLNYTAPIVNASVDPIFKDDIQRDYNETLLFQAFIDDVDRAGTDLQDFMSRTAVLAKLYGVVFVLVNNESVLGESVADNVKNRALPYVTSITPSQLVGYKFDKGVLQEFSYSDVITVDKEKVTRVYKWTVDDWFILDERNEIISQGNHGLGVVPVVAWFGRNAEPTNLTPPSEFLSIAQTNYFLYQLCSWHTQILRDQAFSILTMPDVGEVDITIGTNNVLTYPPESSHVPSFISPDATPANMLTDQMERLTQEMYRMSGIDSVVGVREAKSGVAKQWDFERTNQRLVDFALQCESAEYAMMRMFELWTNEHLNYSCGYPRDFKINDVSESLAQAQQALDLNFNSQTYKGEVLRKVLGSYMPNIESDTYDQIIEEYSTALDTQEQALVYEGKGIDGTVITEDEPSNQRV